MKRVFKNLILIVFTVAISLSCLNDVNAKKVTVESITASAPSYESGATTVSRGHTTFYTNTVDATYIRNGTKINLNYYKHWGGSTSKPNFCLDAQLSAGESKGNIYASRILFYSQGELNPLKRTDRVYLHDLAIAYILKNGSSMENRQYFITSFAIRAIDNLWGYTGQGLDDDYNYGAGDEYSVTALKINDAIMHNVAIWTKNDPEIKGYVDRIKKYYPDFANNVSEQDSMFTGSSIDQAKSLFGQSLSLVADHIEKVWGDGGDLEVKDLGAIPRQDLKVEEERPEGTYVSAVVEHSISVKKPESAKEEDKYTFYLVDAKFDGGYLKYGALSEPKIDFVTVNGNTVCQNSACDSIINTNLFTLVGADVKELNVKVGVKVEGYKKLNEGYEGSYTLLNCDESLMHYNLNAKYGNEEESGSLEYSDYEKFLGVVWYNIASDTIGESHSYQRFYSGEGSRTIEDEGGEKENPGLKDIAFPGEILLNDNCAPCEDLIKDCEECKDLEACACTELIEKADECGCDAFELLCQIELDSGTSLKDTKYCFELINKTCVTCPTDETTESDDEFDLKKLCELDKKEGTPEESSIYCKAYKEAKCEECKDWLDECKEGKEESCEKYEKENCPDCTQMFEACIESGSISSPACKLYIDNRDKLGCPEDCHEWFELCDIGDTESCKKYEDKPCEDASTTECGTEIVGITECCNEGEDALYVDPAFNTEIGMMGSDYDQYYEIHGVKEDKIKFCFVDEVDKNKDPVDDSASKNKYKMMTDSKVASNKYCKVNCREDYAFDFPVAQRVNAGRYFTFRMAITDVHKQCFTNTIDKEQFEKDIKAAQEAIVKATNEYLYWKAAWEHRTDYKYTQGTECPTGCACNQFDNGVYIQVPGVLAWTNPQYKDEYYSFNSQISQPTTQNVYEYEGTIGIHSTGTASCYAGIDAFGVAQYVDKEMTEHDDSPTIPELEQKLTARIDAEWAARVGGVQINAAVAEYARIIAEYNDCSLWETEIQYDPKVEYNYEELEYSNMASMPREMEKEINIGDVSYEYCLQQGAGKGPKITDNEYKNCTTGFTTSWNYLDDAYTVCRVEGDSAKCYRDDQPRHLVSPVRYMKSNQDAESTHKPSALFYNIYPKGEIQMDNSSGKGVALQRDYSGDTLKLLPVALGTPKGVKRYYINVSNIGEFYNDGDGSLGRFAGSNTSKAVVGEKVEYTCAYLINIPEASMKCSTLDTPCDGPDCSTECVGPGCDKDFLCEGIDCVTDCVGIGCIYDKHAGTSIYQREVSLTNIFPNGTDAYNWMKNDKGTTTKDEIESAGNSIFDGTPVLSVTITPSVSRSIQNYNDSQNSSGGYSNDTITCKDFGGYEKLACYSDFITDLINNTYGNVNHKIDSKRDPNNPGSGYFELWSGTPSEKDMLGPSWK